MSEQSSGPKQLPRFANEKEEADWWYDNREQHAADFIQAAKEGRVKVNYMADRLARLRGLTTLKLAEEDKVKAEELAKQHGVTTEAYLSTLVHEALSRETSAGA